MGGENELGIAVGEERLFMSKAEEKAAKKAAAAAKKAERDAKKGKAPKAKKDEEASTSAEAEDDDPHALAHANLKAQKELAASRARICTGVLVSRPTSRDIKIDNFSMGLKGNELVMDCSIELTIGRRYGLVGQNGCGKTNFLDALANREVPIPEHMDLYHLKEEAPPSEMTAVEAVVDYIQEEIKRLNAEEERIMEEIGPEDERLQDIYEKLEELDPSSFETQATKLLVGLGFNDKMLKKKTKDMSGGWRMRVALARALFVQPTLLLLDEPTNHLDLEACVWLEQYLMHYKKCLVIISHSQDFMNGVCTHIIWLTKRKLNYYTGNYDTFKKTVSDEEVIQQKKYEQEQHDIKHLKAFIASCGTYANMVKQAQSKQKIIDKMMAAGLTEPVSRERTFKFKFPECGKLPPPVVPFVDVSFSYSGKKEDYLYRNLEFGIDCDSRIALVGPNGAGKSTLLKLITGELDPVEGSIRRNPHVSIGKFHQHSIDILRDDMTPLEFFQTTYPNTLAFTRDQEGWRAYLGRYGCSGKQQGAKIGTLSEGQKTRLIFAMICMGNPNLLLLDEPTNHLDIEAIDALADAIKAYEGGLVLVSHDFRLLQQVAEEIWVCDGTVQPWKGDILSYKKHLVKNMEKHSSITL
eukprot:CAMPEP_0170144196 /NCGR_PEP_ID=MMETSP0033_2-20121228/13349_1 /TAXON_ID=195969 /ORGANISM="Dolichomastix tenuilepis, Strain CCMP3274" /LENGTH=636 /DNA_ID=CAMNT_0010380681 /DNA_START=124 /DNA_END=2034 /DNA_ORIENTATION=-